MLSLLYTNEVSKWDKMGARYRVLFHYHVYLERLYEENSDKLYQIRPKIVSVN